VEFYSIDDHSPGAFRLKVRRFRETVIHS
jgi:hypothetical protein